GGPVERPRRRVDRRRRRGLGAEAELRSGVLQRSPAVDPRPGGPARAHVGLARAGRSPRSAGARQRRVRDPPRPRAGRRRGPLAIALCRSGRDTDLPRARLLFRYPVSPGRIGGPLGEHLLARTQRPNGPDRMVLRDGHAPLAGAPRRRRRAAGIQGRRPRGRRSGLPGPRRRQRLLPLPPDILHGDESAIRSEGMKAFDGKVLFLDRDDINTDEIIPAKYLSEAGKAALKPNCMEDLRLEGFDPKRDLRDKTAILSRGNFGCGSSREHAPWALEANGINAVIAASFARIFRGNMFNGGMLALS